MCLIFFGGVTVHHFAFTGCVVFFFFAFWLMPSIFSSFLSFITLQFFYAPGTYHDSSFMSPRSIGTVGGQAGTATAAVSHRRRRSVCSRIRNEERLEPKHAAMSAHDQMPEFPSAPFGPGPEHLTLRCMRCTASSPTIVLKYGSKNTEIFNENLLQ